MVGPRVYRLDQDQDQGPWSGYDGCGGASSVLLSTKTEAVENIIKTTKRLESRLERRVEQQKAQARKDLMRSFLGGFRQGWH
jgi:hypothetical protein